jgi:hypothetical protein
VQLGIAESADALLVIPKTLAVNAAKVLCQLFGRDKMFITLSAG